jgi:predicted AAA+ superfamily ATPase
MLTRRLEAQIRADLEAQAAVALLGPRQVGKTTLAHALGDATPSIYLDLEDPADRDKLADPALYLQAHEDKLVILDEIQNTPDLFRTLRGLIDKGRRKGRKSGRFLLLGSASIELLRQSSESLAGRIAYRELAPLDVTETGGDKQDILWLRGGFPRSFLARGDAKSFDWRRDFLRTYLTRDIPALEPRIPAETLRRLWTMLAHAQGTQLNASRLATGLSISSPTVARYIDLLVDLLLVRRLLPYHANLGKRLIKSPKVYVRDSGLLHALLAVQTLEALYDHPIVGPSWEGFVVETLVNCAPAWTNPFYYRTSAGAEIDLLLELPGGELWAVEIKRSLSPKVERGFHIACDDLKPQRRFVVYAGNERVPLPHNVEAVGLHALAEALAAMG